MPEAYRKHSTGTTFLAFNTITTTTTATAITTKNKQEEESQCNKSMYQMTKSGAVNWTLRRNSQLCTASQSVPKTIVEMLNGIGKVCL